MSKKILSFNRKNIREFESGHIWHGSYYNGEKAPKRCNNWSYPKQDDYGTGSRNTSVMLEESLISCSKPGIVLCIRNKWTGPDEWPRRDIIMDDNASVDDMVNG